MMSKQARVGKLWLSFGYGKRLSLGFCIDKFGIQLDFLCFWLGVEF